MREQPFLWSLGLLALGILIAEVGTSWLWPFWLAFAFWFLLLALSYFKPELARVCLLLAIVVLGFARMQFVLHRYYLFSTDFQEKAQQGKLAATATGQVIASREYDWGTVFEVKLDSFSPKLRVPPKGKFELISKSALTPGALIEVRGYFKLPPKERNPCEGSRRRQLAQKGFYLTVTSEEVTVVGEKKSLLAQFKARLTAPWQKLPPQERGLLQAVILGERQLLDEEVAQGFTALGLAHLLSVSGLHVGFVLLLFQKLTPPPVTILLMFLYTLAAGWQPPAVRALLMLSMGLVATMLERPQSSLNALGLAGFLLLLVNPLLLKAPGFLLSFGATLSIIWANSRLPGKQPLLKLLGLSLAAQLGTLPIIAHFFNQFVPLAPVANLLFGGLFGFLVQGGLLAGILGLFLPPVGAALALGLYPLARFLNKIVAYLGTKSWGLIAVRSWQWWEFLLYYGTLFLVLKVWSGALSWPSGLAGISRDDKRREARGKIIAIVSLVFCLWLGLPKLWQVFDPSFVVTVFDVGQGESILLKTPEGKYVLVDGGPKELQVDRLLTKLGVKKLSLAVLTHQHKDHEEGFWPALARRSPRLLWIDEKAPLGMRVRIDDVVFELLGGGRGSDPNQRSLIVLASYRGRAVLLTGDAPVEYVELALRERELPPFLYKVPHHGAKGSVSGRLPVEKMFAACISSGEGNPFGHPHPETIEMLEGFGLVPGRTDRNGCVRYVFSRQGVRVRKFIWEKGLW